MMNSNMQRAEAQTGDSFNASPVEDVSSLSVPAVVTVSTDLVEDLLVQLLLKLHPLERYSSAHLDQQQLLTHCLHLSATTLETLRKDPGVSVDEDLPPPSCEAWKAVALLVCSVMERFGTTYRIRKLVLNKDPALLSFIPDQIIETVLQIYKDQSEDVWIPPQIPFDEDGLLFSQFLPENIKEEMLEQYGPWIRRMKIFQRAFTKTSDEEILENQKPLIEPVQSIQDIESGDEKDFVVDSEEEKTADDTCCLQQEPCSEDHKKVSDSEEKQSDDGAQNLQLPELSVDQLMADDNQTTEQNLQTTRAVVEQSTIKQVLLKLFKPPNFCTPRSQRSQDFDDEMVEHIHMLLQKEAKKYEKNRIFLKHLNRLKDPKEEVKISQKLHRTIKARLRDVLPNTRLKRDDLMEDAQAALSACSLISSEIMNYLKPSVSFAPDTKPGDETPYSFNIPIKRETTGPGRELTQLELHAQQQQAGTREKVNTEETKMNRIISWFCKPFKKNK
ncbi:uncharacterized protein LOC117813857 [Notolabrus celidotus]|uniref:uncharacterized protein LOC117813857 n=1 Tax=Notolabrus celidotus TaxID=1203425 RepID=UPI00148FDD44|nr:uncharacterized protein LOC117813857 [Notolabrus celidotus]